ncbi:MAG: type II and III secretion system protein, partial [Elusimicrobiales bacterium]|nr:type II and III secretion system protein [Elusimicrobiales bacterium]
FAQRRYKDAQNQFSYALLYAPESPDFLRALSVASYYARDLEAGGWAAEKAVSAAPETTSAWRTAALVRAARGDLKGAEEAFLRYKELTGRDKSALTEWSAERLRSRLDDWSAFHSANPAVTPAGIFGRGAQPESKPLELGDGGENYDDSAEAPSSAPAAGGDGPAAAASNPNAPKMALVDVVILRTEESRSQSKGINILAGLKATLTGTLFQYKWASGGTIIGGSGHGMAVSPTFALEGLEYNLNIWNDSVNKAEVLARPSLLAVENQESKFYSGAVLHVQLNSVNADGSMVDVPVGINLSVTPTFLDPDTVRIKVHADRSFIETRSEKLGFSAFSQSSKTSVDATAILRFGETLILSGLTENETAVSKSGVPLLQSIPIVQWFFSHKAEEETKKTVLILLSPHKARRASEHMTPREAKEIKRASRLGRQAVEHLKTLKKKEGLAGKDNLDAVFEIMDNDRYYREFRTGDLQLDEWHNSDTFVGSIKRALGFLWY